MKKLFSVLTAVALVFTSMLTSLVGYAQGTGPNLVQNGDFSAGSTGWTLSNNGKSGVNNGQFWLDPAGRISQTIVITETDTYSISGVMSTQFEGVPA